MSASENVLFIHLVTTMTKAPNLIISNGVLLVEMAQLKKSQYPGQSTEFTELYKSFHEGCPSWK